MRRDHDRYMKLKYLKAVAAVQYQFKDWLDKTDQKLLQQGLRSEDLKTQIETVKKIDQYRTTFKGRNRSAIMAKVETLLGVNAVIALEVGGKGKPESSNKSNGCHMIHVGYMWLYRVHKPLYVDAERRDYKKYLILSADRVRVTSEIFNLYEVKAYNPNTGKAADGYVAQAKHAEQKHSAFGFTVAQAIKGAEQLMSVDINKVMGIN